MEFEYMQFLASNISRLPKDWIQPTPIEDIEQIEQTLNITIPKALKEFFLLAGNNYGTLLYDIVPMRQCVQNLALFQEKATIYFLEIEQQPLSNALFFSLLPDSMHFVRLNGEDNPVVYYWEPDFFEGIIYEGDFPFTPEQGPGIKTTVRFNEYVNRSIRSWLDSFEIYEKELLERPIVSTAVHKQYKLEFVMDYPDNLVMKNIYPLADAQANINPLLYLLRYLCFSGYVHAYAVQVETVIEGKANYNLNYKEVGVQLLNEEAILQMSFFPDVEIFTLPAMDFLQILKELDYFYYSFPLVGSKPGGPSNYVPPVFERGEEQGTREQREQGGEEQGTREQREQGNKGEKNREQGNNINSLPIHGQVENKGTTLFQKVCKFFRSGFNSQF